MTFHGFTLWSDRTRDHFPFIKPEQELTALPANPMHVEDKCFSELPVFLKHHHPFIVFVTMKWLLQGLFPAFNRDVRLAEL